MKVFDRIRLLGQKASFAWNVSVLAGGAAAGQGVVIVASPLLTRLYTPEDFGLLAVFGGLLGLLGVVACLRYELAVPLPESDEEGISIVALSMLAALGMTVVTAVAVSFFREPIAILLGVPTLKDYLWMLPVGLLLFGTYRVFSYWSLRIRAFGAVARSKLIQSVAMVGIQLVGYPFGVSAMIMGLIAGQGAGFARLAVPAFRLARSRPGRFSWKVLQEAAIRYRRFPIYSTWGAILNSASSQLPVIMLASLFNAGVAGVYFLAHRVVALPSAMIGSAVSQVFLSRAAEAARNGGLKPMVANVHERLSQIVMPVVVLMVVAAPWVFPMAFGERWEMAGRFTQWMAPSIYFQFVASPLSLLFVVLERQRAEVLFQGVLLVSRIAALVCGGLTGDPMLAVALLALASAASYLAMLIWGMRASNNEAALVATVLARQLLIGLVLVAPSIVAGVLDVGPDLWIASLTLTGVLVLFRYYQLFMVSMSQ